MNRASVQPSAASTAARFSVAPGVRLRAAIIGLHLITIALLGLHLYVRTLPPAPTVIPELDSTEGAWWGLWMVHYVPWRGIVWGATGVVLLTAYCLLLTGRRGMSKYVVNDDHRDQRLPLATCYLLLAILLPLLYLFPAAHTRWGDAEILINAIAWPDETLRLTHSWQAPLDVWLHAQTWRLLHEPLRWGQLERGAMPVYHLLSPIAGLLYLGATVALARDRLLTRALAPGWLIAGLLLTIGVMQLFFGYIENYSFAAAGILIYLWLGLRALPAPPAAGAPISGRTPLWVAALALAITNATHPSTVILAPSLLYLGWKKFQREDAGAQGVDVYPITSPRLRASALNFWGNPAFWPIVLQIALPMILVAAGTVALMTAGNHGVDALFTRDRPGGGDARWLVPLFATQTYFERYTMFSWLHLRDVVNEQLLVAPVVGISVAYCLLLSAGGRVGRAALSLPSDDSQNAEAATNEPTSAAISSKHYARFLSLAAGFHLLLTLVWNPDYGGQRDWDLFSLAAIPATLLLATLLPRVLGHGRALVAGASPLILLQGLHLAAWVYQNTLPWHWPR